MNRSTDCIVSAVSKNGGWSTGARQDSSGGHERASATTIFSLEPRVCLRHGREVCGWWGPGTSAPRRLSEDHLLCEGGSLKSLLASMRDFISKRLINLDRRKRGAELEEALKPRMGVLSWRMVAGKSPNNLKSLVNTDFKYTARLL